ncbi:hypothetical protein [Falsarthrobacter nasiphocae]|uniref:Uncharacterized protein n=1 Tax=Falsarthrobacter nasiphocae TaxID=189863 RepID=A0AAE3YCV1_9MICC|nr:hypothetical protein [Falsarthrobacter nasiphocae]MDR6891543.1 hypothetical protein [Falsarthrobacter nasiphocae]
MQSTERCMPVGNEVGLRRPTVVVTAGGVLHSTVGPALLAEIREMLGLLIDL